MRAKPEREKTPRPKVETPCINICQIDRESRLCNGCYRTLDEIAAWSGMTNAQRKAVMQQIPGRAAKQS